MSAISTIRGSSAGQSTAWRARDHVIGQVVNPAVERARMCRRGASGDVIGSREKMGEAVLFDRYRRDRDPAAREQLVARYLPLAHHFARRYRGRAERDDLIQVAALGLLKAIDRFDPERGLAFSSFAVPTILGELKRHFRDRGWMIRVPRGVQELSLRLDTVTQTLTGELGRSPTAAELAGRAGASVEDVLEALAAATAHHPDSLDRPITDEGDGAVKVLAIREDPGFARVEDAAMIDGLMATLPARDRTVLRLRFEDDLTQAEIGRLLGISQMQVSRIIRQSITALNQHAASQPPTGFTAFIAHPSGRDRA
jgi:RNA polymerase sigma-B factor